MKNLFFFYFSLLWLPLFAQDIIWLTPVEHDFGEFEQFDIQQVAFKFKNNSGEAVVVDNVRTTCGCTSPDWSDEPIPADSTSVITIEYDARKIGFFYKKVKVYFSGIRKGEKLSVEGEVVEKT